MLNHLKINLFLKHTVLKWFKKHIGRLKDKPYRIFQWLLLTVKHFFVLIPLPGIVRKQLVSRTGFRFPDGSGFNEYWSEILIKGPVDETAVSDKDELELGVRVAVSSDTPSLVSPAAPFTSSLGSPVQRRTRRSRSSIGDAEPLKGS